MLSRKCVGRSGSIVEFSASVIVLALVFDHSREVILVPTAHHTAPSAFAGRESDV